MWRAGGGLLTGRVRTGPVSATARPVHDATSLPLADIVGDINKFSNNVMAQQLFLTLGRLPTEAVASANARTPTAAATFERSRALVGRWWRNRFGASVAEPSLDNGSGLSRDERISADALLAPVARCRCTPDSWRCAVAVVARGGCRRHGHPHGRARHHEGGLGQCPHQNRVAARCGGRGWLCDHAGGDALGGGGASSTTRMPPKAAQPWMPCLNGWPTSPVDHCDSHLLPRHT
jgi:hypothetical protein